MKNFTEADIERLKQQGKIRGFHGTEKQKGFSADNRIQQPESYQSTAREWLEWNLMDWSNEHALDMRWKGHANGEYRFHPERKWRFDFAWPSIRVAVEYEGGIFRQYEGAQGAHGSSFSYTKDCDKYNAATVLGWRVIRVTAANYKTVFDHIDSLFKRLSS